MQTNLKRNDTYAVNATELNLRREPEIHPENIIAQLSYGHRVRKLSATADQSWWRVSTDIQTASLVGFVSHRFLVPADQFISPSPHQNISEVHLITSKPVVRSEARGRAFPLNESGQPRRTATTPAGKAAELGQIIEWLNVEQNERYQRITGGSTFCNIYTFDYCYLANVYLPRVWWKATAIAQLAAGQAVTPIYGETVAEKNANDLLDWFKEFGTDFGWVRSFDLTDLQRAANNGQVTIICAQQKDLNLSGHICVVAPETAEHRATWSGSEVAIPLQSQAGAKNFSYGGRRWWTGDEFRSFGFWRHI